MGSHGTAGGKRQGKDCENSIACGGSGCGDASPTPGCRNNAGMQKRQKPEHQAHCERAHRKPAKELEMTGSSSSRSATRTLKP